MPPTSGQAAVWDQLRKAHDYYNRLVLLELWRRLAFREARGALAGELPALEAELAELNQRIKDARGDIQVKRAKNRKRVEDPVVAAQVKALQAERKPLAERIKAARKEVVKVYGPGNDELSRLSAEKAGGNKAAVVRAKTNAAALAEMLADPAWSEEWKIVARLDGEATAAGKLFRSECGLTPGTYMLVEKAVEAAFRPPKKGEPPRPDPSPKGRFEGRGRIGIQLHQLSVADLLAGRHRQVQLRMSDRLPNGKHATQRYGTLRLRVTPDMQFAEVPVKLHRPLPPDGVVTQLWLLVQRDGPRTRYSLQCVVESAQWERPAPVKGTGIVAIDTGWRLVEEGIRVAYWVDDHNRHGQIVVPKKAQAAVAHASVLRGHADRHFDEARATLRSWMAEHAQALPEWLPAATESIAQWRAHWKLIRVARRLTEEYLPQAPQLWGQWLAHRQAANLDEFAPLSVVAGWLQAQGPVPPLVQLAVYMEFWRRKDAHLYDWETRERRHAENIRRELFRKVAQVSRQYEQVMIEQIDLPKFNKNAPPEEQANQEWMHEQQRLASPGDLAARIMEACKGRSTKVTSHNTTRTCHRCEHVNAAWEHPERLVQTCAGCSAEWDQDENACRVMLGRAYAPDGERPGDAIPPAPARGSENTPETHASAAAEQPFRSPGKGLDGHRSQSSLQSAEMIAGLG